MFGYVLFWEESMASKIGNKNAWVLIILLLAGVVIGGFLGDITNISWLNYGKTFGLTSPLVLDFGVIALTFALTIRITVASIIGIIIAVLIYRFM